MGKLTLTIELPDDITDNDLMVMRGVKSSLTSDGIPEDVHTWLILAAAEAYERDTKRREYEGANPLVSSEFVEAIVAPAARLALVDGLMHLPMGASEATITPI